MSLYKTECTYEALSPFAVIEIDRDLPICTCRSRQDAEWIAMCLDFYYEQNPVDPKEIV